MGAGTISGGSQGGTSSNTGFGSGFAFGAETGGAGCSQGGTSSNTGFGSGFAFGTGADARGAGIAPLYTVCSSLSMRAHSVGTSSHSSGRQSRIRHNSAAMRGLGCDAIAPSVCWML